MEMDLTEVQPLWDEIEIKNQAHVFLARGIAGDFSRRLGFTQKKQADIILSASEMAQNHVAHHTSAGRMLFFGHRIGNNLIMSISSLDRGPGIINIKRALQDGVSTSKGLGSGLGCIKRLADEFAICSGKIGSDACPDLLTGEKEFLTLVAAAFLVPDHCLTNTPVKFFHLIRPANNGQFCGDSFYFSHDQAFVSLIVIDALGHGKSAAEAAARAIEAIEILPPATKPIEVLLRAGETLVHTRGMAAQAIRIDLQRRIIETATVGNVNQRLYLDGKPQYITGKSGVLGPVTSRSMILEKRYSNFTQAMGLIFTDGVRRIPELRFNQAIMSFPPMLWTQYLFNSCDLACVPQDDATLVVWKWQD